MQRENTQVPAVRRRSRRGRPVMIILLCAMTVTMLAAMLYGRGGAAAGEASAGSASNETRSPDEVDALLSRLGAAVTEGMAVNECGAGHAAELRSLALRETGRARQLNFMADNIGIYTEDAVRTALLGGDHIDFALELPFRTPDASGLDAAVDVNPGEIPYLSQYDARWAYHAYGSSVTGITGCGPTCLAMAVAGLRGDTSANPARMADFAMANGYYADGAGTMWSLFTEGAANYGLTGTEIPLDENVMLGSLSSGSVIIASMLPGDFTQSGHFILIYGYDGSGFRLHDPNSAERSAQSWTYERLAGQIANLWSLSA